MLVIHTRRIPGSRGALINTIQEEAISNARLSTDPLDEAEYEKLVASADIGLALYKPLPKHNFSHFLQKNIQYIGLSSGKFASYAKHGLAILSVQQASLRKLSADYRFGLDLDSVDSIPDALLQLSKSLAEHKRESRRMFEETLDFAVHWPSISDRLKRLAKEGRRRRGRLVN